MIDLGTIHCLMVPMRLMVMNSCSMMELMIHHLVHLKLSLMVRYIHCLVHLMVPKMMMDMIHCHYLMDMMKQMMELMIHCLVHYHYLV
jgi:hypothetical protein